MIVIDSSIWIDHLHASDERVIELTEAGAVLIHPFVIGEIMLGNIRNRTQVVESLVDLPEADIAEHFEVLALLENARLFGRGIGFIDLNVLASVLITPKARLWTRDKRLLIVANELGIAYAPDH